MALLGIVAFLETMALLGAVALLEGGVALLGAEGFASLHFSFISPLQTSQLNKIVRLNPSQCRKDRALPELE